MVQPGVANEGTMRNFSLRDCRILEIGDNPYFKRLLPRQTTFYSVARRDESPKDLERKSILRGRPAVDKKKMTLLKFVRVLAALRRGDYSLVSVMAAPKPIWDASRSWPVNVAHLISTLIRKFRLCGIYVLRFVPRNKVPIVVIDPHDEPTIRRHNLWLLSRSRLYFKRELPQNYWKLFLNATALDIDTSHVRRQPLYRKAISQFRPLPMPFFIESTEVETGLTEKTHDAFYAGNIAHATVRERGIHSLQNLLRQGYRIDVPAARIPYPEFVERCRRSWLVWSPEGLGWKCRRHYEAILLGSVPIINYPNIFQYKPLIDGEHCFYYGCEDDLLERTIVRALEDKDRLRRMVRAGQSYLMQHFSREAITAFVESEIQTSS